MKQEENALSLRFDKSFQAKMRQIDEPSKSYYQAIKNHALSYKGTRARISWNYETVNIGRKKILKLAVKGKTLCVYLALDPRSADAKYKVEPVEVAKFEETPCLYRIRNPRRVTYAKELIDILMKSLGIEKGKEVVSSYDFPYQSIESLIEQGLIKDRSK